MTNTNKNFEVVGDKYRMDIRHFVNSNKEQGSVVMMSLVLTYDDWKKTFSENLARYDAENSCAKVAE